MNAFLKSLTLLAAGILCLVSATSPTEASLSITPAAQSSLPPLPDPVGRAGMAAGVVTNADGTQTILAAGGANFPEALPWQGGKKVFYRDIFKLKNGQWEKAGDLPIALGYAAFAGTSKGLVIAGGADNKKHFSEAWLVTPDGKTVNLPSLPEPIAYPAFTTRNNRLYVMGGQSAPDSVTAVKSVYVMDLSNLNSEKQSELSWKKLPDIPGAGRILAAAGASGSNIYLFGGASLSENDQGTAQRTYLKSVLAFDSAGEKWLTEEQIFVPDMPCPLVGTPSPLPVREGKILLMGGDTGSHYGQSPETHPGQSRNTLIYNTLSHNWEKGGEWPLGLATAPTVLWGKKLFTISGETKPGVRTPLMGEASLSYSLDLNPVDYAVFALVVLVVLLIIFQIRKKGIHGVSLLSDGKTGPGRYAWVIVGLLWVVAMLNYFDRQLLTAIREPIIRDIPQTEMQFGMLTGVFLLIYSFLSPVGGFLADRYSRRLVILCSLVVWSIVTWITGHVHDYNTLFAARALMGISEACYIPAALALITDYHRGRTRSLATGIHMSGIYAGMALAGWGGDMAEATGWRLTFGVFGLVGVGYALVLVLFLREPSGDDLSPASDADTETGSSDQEASPGIGFVFKKLLSSRPLWVLMGVVACAGAANWFLLAWFPTLLQEKFNLSLGDAGKNATLWSTMAKYIAVLAGAVIADQWSIRNPRGRSLLPGIIFCLAGPLIALSPFIPAAMSGALVILLLFVASQGLAQGTLDATLMPVMRSHVGGRFAATGYGFLNLVSAGFGAFTVIYGGKLKDMGISLDTTLAYTGGLLLLGGILLLLLPKPGIRK